MKVINLDRFAKCVLMLSLVAFVASCGDEPEETTAQNQIGVTEEAVQSDEIVTGSVPVESGEAESGEIMEEESLESILAKADEIIQRTGGALNGEVEPEPEETTASGAEETGSVAVAPATDSAAGSADDGQEVVKATPDLIRKVQQALTDAGLNPGVADGKLGPRSRGALIDFQKQHGLAEGRITKETLRELGIDF